MWQNCTTNLSEFPQFLRVDTVCLNYCFFVVPISEVCRAFINYLQPLKKTLKDSNLIDFFGSINNNRSTHFSDHSKLLDHLQNELLPICDSSRAYEFDILFYSDENAGRDVIASILKQQTILRCSNVAIKLSLANWPLQLPIEPISNWLHRKCDGINENERSAFSAFTEERFLQIHFDKFQNATELCDYLKTVITITLFSFKFVTEISNYS